MIKTLFDDYTRADLYYVITDGNEENAISGDFEDTNLKRVTKFKELKIVKNMLRMNDCITSKSNGAMMLKNGE